MFVKRLTASYAWDWELRSLIQAVGYGLVFELDLSDERQCLVVGFCELWGFITGVKFLDKRREHNDLRLDSASWR